MLVSEGSWLGNNNHSFDTLVECEIQCVSRLEQKIEATVGCQVQKNDGKRHALEKKKKEEEEGGH